MIVDIAAGILISVGIAHLFGASLTWLLVIIGILAALFPDLDTLTRFFPERHVIRRIVGVHRGLLHRPLFVILLSCLAFFAGPLIGTIVVCGVIYHLVHDTFFLGWGIKWLWPFSELSISIFHDRRGSFVPYALVWQPEDDARIKAEYSTDDWVQTFYFRPTLISLTEYPGLVIALIVLYLSMR